MCYRNDATAFDNAPLISHSVGPARFATGASEVRQFQTTGAAGLLLQATDYLKFLARRL